MSKSRKFMLSLLLLPAVAVAVFCGGLSSDARRDFLDDYASNLGRLVRGEWEFSELHDPARSESRGRGRRFGRRNGSYEAHEVFAKLDRDADDSLSTQELGHRLAGRAPYLPVDIEGFRQILAQSWVPSELASGTATAPSMPGSRSNASAPGSSDTEAPRLRADDLLDPHQVMIVDVELSDQDWRSLCHQTRSHQSAHEDPLDKPYTSFRGNVIINGHVIRDVAIRKKGFIGSQDTVRPSLKIKFDEYVEQTPVEGLDRLTLNNNRQDRALVSQALTYFLFRKAGIDAPRSSFAAVTVNGQYLGVYTHVESVKKPFLQRVYGSDEGVLYEGTLTDLYPKSIEWIEPKTKASAEDLRLITQLANTLHDEDSSLEQIAAIVDVPAFLRFWAVESLINFWDGYSQNQNNYFLSENPTNGLVYFIPWGADSCFGGRPRFVQRRGEYAESVRATGILANKLYHFDEIPTQYRETMLDILEHVWDEAELLAEIDRIETMLRDHMDVPQIRAIVDSDQVREFIKTRREALVPELMHAWPAEVADRPRIPQYRETVGTTQGTFTRSAEGPWQASLATTFNGQSYSIEKFDFDERILRLSGRMQENILEIRLYWNGLPPDANGQHQLTGEVLQPYQQRLEIVGTMTLSPNEIEPTHGTLDFVVRERRGGRW